MHLQLLGEDVGIAEVVAEACECGRVVECRCTDAAVLEELDGVVAGDGRAAAVADQNDFLAGVVRLTGRLGDPFEACAQVERSAFLMANPNRPQETTKLVE